MDFGFYFYSQNNTNSNNNYEANKTSASNSNNNNKPENNNSSEPASNKGPKEQNPSDINTNENKKNEEPTPSRAPVEEQIGTFSTKIYSPNDTARQNNISITCGTLNGTIVKNGETFSFCNTVGQATTAKGYQKADIFDKYGNKKKGLGGGNCQISTTLYNAVLPIPNLIVTERHAHSNYVPYIAKGKDAAVAYGSYDLKFRNDSGNDVKIMSSTDGSSVTVGIIALK